MASFKKILVIQTAFIGDVVLATALVEKLYLHFPAAKIDFLLRKGNEGLLDNHPHINKVLVWNKKTSKYTNLLKLVGTVRNANYDLIVNLQRFFSTGFLTAFSGANTTVCFDKNPLSFFASHRVPHRIGTAGNNVHEVERNLALIAQWTDNQTIKPKIYPSKIDFERSAFHEKYITISPASVWFTKQFPKEKWLEMMNRVGEDTTIFLLGGPTDKEACNWLKNQTRHPKTIVKAGEFSFLESAALMKNASMNFVNDSAPLHFASAVDAPVTAVFCSTVPSFGFWPLSTNSVIVETLEELACRPCGLHGKNACPEGHFNCSKLM
ncbi:MAG: glycosyltransferase family 9 protein [Saprospiraceae bacterium]|nr:glycosyltransferase family 9 protein [Saprospiraceae bacterium]